MGNMSECLKTMEEYARARIPFVVLHTVEVARAEDIFRKVSATIANPFYIHSSTKGMREISSDRAVNDDHSLVGALDYIAEQIRIRQNLTFVLTEVTELDSDTNVARQMLATVHLAVENGGMIIVITTDGIWNQLQRVGMRLELSFPLEEEMLEIIRSFIEENSQSATIEWNEHDYRQAAALLAGVSQIEAENVLASLLVHGRITKADLAGLRFVKDRLFSDISGLERIHITEKEAQVGGLRGLRRWLDEKQKLQDPEKQDYLRAHGLPFPRGILLTGVPGCGKSISAKAIAARWMLPLYRLDFATVQGMYVGQSERQLRDALLTAEQVSPCVLWIDEIEKGLSGAISASGDGGVSQRMVGQFLFWLQECRKNVFVVATANDVSRLPSELLRRGRFDEIFFIDLPTAEERREIISLHYTRYLKEEISVALLDKLVAISEGFTGADLESAVRDLGYHKATHDDQMMEEPAIIAHIENVIPLSKTSPEKIEEIRAWGRERAVPASGDPIGGKVLPGRPQRVILG